MDTRGALSQGLDKIVRPFKEDGTYNKRLGRWRSSMLRNTILVKDEIGKIKYVAPLPVSDLIYVPPPQKTCKKQWHVPDSRIVLYLGLDHHPHCPSRHHTSSEIDFIKLNNRALNRSLQAPAHYQEFYKIHRHLESQCVAYCNCADVDTVTGFKRVLTKKNVYPEPPDPIPPTEEQAGACNFLIPYHYGRMWLIREQAKQFHERATFRVHKHTEVHREVNRDLRFLVRRQQRLKRSHHPTFEQTNTKQVPPNPRYIAVPADISTYRTEQQRQFAFQENVARKAGTRNPIIPALVTKPLHNPRLLCPRNPPRLRVSRTVSCS